MEPFMEDFQKTSQEKFRIEKIIKRKSKWKRPGTKKSQYFPRPFRSFGGNINVKVDISSYATKTDLKIVTHVDTSSFALKTNLASLKTEFDKLHIDKLAPVLVDLSKLSDVVKMKFLKKLCIIN